MTHMSNNNEDKYPAFHAPSPYSKIDFLEVFLTFAAIIIPAALLTAIVCMPLIPLAIRALIG